MRLKKEGLWYQVQWNIIPLRKNREYALERSRRGYIDGQSGIQVFSETLYRIKTKFPDAGFTRHWMQEYVAHVWDGAAAPSTHQLRDTVIVEPMLAESLPADGRFMRQAQERLRDAFVASSTCIDDDKLRKLVRGMITQRMVVFYPTLVVVTLCPRPRTNTPKQLEPTEVVAMFAEAQIKFEQLCGRRRHPLRMLTMQPQKEKLQLSKLYSGMRTLLTVRLLKSLKIFARYVLTAKCAIQVLSACS